MSTHKLRHRRNLGLVFFCLLTAIWYHNCFLVQLQIIYSVGDRICVSPSIANKERSQYRAAHYSLQGTSPLRWHSDPAILSCYTERCPSPVPRQPAFSDCPRDSQLTGTAVWTRTAVVVFFRKWHHLLKMKRKIKTMALKSNVCCRKTKDRQQLRKWE